MSDCWSVPIVHPWQADAGDGTYRNPILLADYSDPDVVRDGDDFWLTASSFHCTPGLPILHSVDLVNWTIVNHAVRNLPDPRGVFDRVPPGCGVWAPAIRKHAGRFWIFFPMPDEGIYVTTADDPRGTWSPPHLLLAGEGLIDPCPLWDDDGRAYLVHAYARSRAGIKDRLRVVEMAPDATTLRGEGTIVFHDPSRHPTLEGPKFHKRNGWYYISAPAGGVRTGWQVVLRSREVFGPYEDRIVLAQGRTPINGPHQGALVDTPAGDWWFVHFQDAAVYGRVLHLQPVRWEDDWPAIGVPGSDGIGEPVPSWRKPVAGGVVAVPQTSDEFDSPDLGLQWQWHANHRDDWCSLRDRPGFLRLRALPPEPDLGATANLLLQKFPARSFSAETEVELPPHFVGQAGMIVAGRAHAALVLEQDALGQRLLLIANHRPLECIVLGSAWCRLRVDVSDGGWCRFSCLTASGARAEMASLFQAVAGQWIGAKIGLFCRSLSRGGSSGHADFGHFRFAPPDPA